MKCGHNRPRRNKSRRRCTLKKKIDTWLSVKNWYLF